MLMAMAAGFALVSAVMVDAREVRVGDLVRDGEGRRVGGAASMRVVLRLPVGQRRTTLSGAAVAIMRVAVAGGR